QDICELIQAWVSVRTLASVAAAFDAHRVLWGPYQTFKELVEHDPRASLKNPLFAAVDHPELGTYPTPGSPLTLAGADPRPPARPWARCIPVVPIVAPIPAAGGGLGIGLTMARYLHPSTHAAQTATLPKATEPSSSTAPISAATPSASQNGTINVQTITARVA